MKIIKDKKIIVIAGSVHIKYKRYWHRIFGMSPEYAVDPILLHLGREGFIEYG